MTKTQWTLRQGNWMCKNATYFWVLGLKDADLNSTSTLTHAVQL